MTTSIQINGTDYRMRENGAVVASTTGASYPPVYNRYGTPVRVADETAFKRFVCAREKREQALRDQHDAIWAREDKSDIDL